MGHRKLTSADIERMKARVKEIHSPPRKVRERKSNRPQGIRVPSPDLAILSPCGNFCRMTPNPFYKEEMEIYNAKRSPEQDWRKMS